MADVGNEEDWEYEDEEAEDYEWEYSEEEEEEEAVEGKEELEDVPLDEQDLPDPFSAAPLEATTKKEASVSPTPNGNSAKSHHKREKKNGEENGKRHHRKHKKSRHLERIEAFKKKEEGGEDEYRNKKIHVRSKDPSRIARQFEKGSSKSHHKSRGRGKIVAPPPQKIEQICRVCGKEPYLVERIVAEKAWWHKNCFRCKQCNKSLNLDSYMSHEGVIYCKPHHRELFQPKIVVNSEADLKNEAIKRHKEQERRMETIIRENDPVVRDDVVKASVPGREGKYAGLEDLDVGSKYKMFEKEEDEDLQRGPASDRYGIMEKLKRLQEGADLDELLAEMDEELPSASGSEEDEEEYGLTEVQKRALRSDKLFGEQDKRDRIAEQRRRELQLMRARVNTTGPRETAKDQIDDLLNASANKIKKTQVDVRSKNAARFRELFDKGEVPEGMSSTDRTIAEKEAELELMRKGRRDERDYFKKLEEGKIEEGPKKEPKLLVGKLKDVEANEDIDTEVPEMASLASRFSFFENHEEKEKQEEEKRRRSRRSPPKLSKSHVFEDPNEDEDIESRKPRNGEVDHARRECKARSVLNKFKQMEQRAINGEEEVKPDDPDKPVMTALGFLGKLPGVGDRRPLKRFTPPRRSGSQSESEYYDSDDSGSYYSDSDSYSASSYTGSETDDDEIEDETLRAIRDAQRAKELRNKFEKWEKTQDAQDQSRQIMIHDENGECLETAGNLKARFEALQMRQQEQTPPPQRHFQPRRFK